MQTFSSGSIRALIERARRILSENDLGASTKPSPDLYPHQWNWDSGFIAIGICHFDANRAQTEIRSLLRGQWRDGMIPHIIYDPDASGYFPDPHRWQTRLSAAAPQTVLTSGITQPPMITIAAWECVLRSGDRYFAEEIYPPLLAYHRWFHRQRDPYAEGLAAIIHPWESGLDNSPRWVEILNGIRLPERPQYQRRDNSHVPDSQRPSHADYDRYVYLMDFARQLAYDQSAILAQFPFVVQDVLLNSILYRADHCLRQLAELIGQPASEIEEWQAAARRAFENKLWHENDGLYYDFDLRNAHPIQHNTVAALMPLYAGLIGSDRADRLVRDHLWNRVEYAPDAGNTRYLVPTTSKTDPHFDPRRYWRGPIWLNTNWLLIRGLERYGYADLARQIRDDTLALIQTAGFHEYFDPRTGAGYGTDSFSWSAALAIDLLEEEKK